MAGTQGTRTTATQPSSSCELLETPTLLHSIDPWTGEVVVASTSPSPPGESLQFAFLTSFQKDRPNREQESIAQPHK